MKAFSHLAINTIIIAVVSIFLFNYLQFNILDLDPIPLIITIYLFSTLPDIDNTKSIVTKSFFLVYILLAIVGGMHLWHNDLKGGYEIAIAIAASTSHFFLSSAKKTHRQFPHTFTFGLLSASILWVLTSWIFAIIGFSCFALHLVEDMHVHKALSNDIALLKRIFTF